MRTAGLGGRIRPLFRQALRLRIVIDDELSRLSAGLTGGLVADDIPGGGIVSESSLIVSMARLVRQQSQLPGETASSPWPAPSDPTGSGYHDNT